MGRPATMHEERKDQIITAALEMFAQKGYDGTTNRLIAQAAGLNSAALIYHYFPSKSELFKNCLERLTALEDLQRELMSGQDKPPEIYLRKVGLVYLKTLSQGGISRLALMIISAAQSHPELLPILTDKLTEVIIFPLLKYFTRQVAEGRMQAIPPLNAGQQFMGPLLLRAFASRMLEKSLPFVFASDEEFVDSHVKVFLDGIRPRGEQ
jgi:AcrR family transcriptional regulator